MKDNTRREAPALSINSRITKFFLNNSRLTILLLALVIVLGFFVTTSLKTTGFPTIKVNVIGISVVYPGARSEKVKNDLVKPIEDAIKDIPEIDSYTSTSSNSFGQIVVRLIAGSDLDSTRSKIDAEVKSIVLPSGAETPSIRTFNFGNQEFYFTLMGSNKKQLYEAYGAITDELGNLPETATINAEKEIAKEIVVELNNDKLNELRISANDVESKIKSFGEEIPVGSDITLNGKSRSIATSLKGTSVEDLKNIKFIGYTFKKVFNFVIPEAKTYKLKDIAKVTTRYDFENGEKSSIAYNNSEDKPIFTDAVTFTVNTIENSDSTAYSTKVRDILKNISQIEYITREELTDFKLTSKPVLIESYSRSDENQKQVDEVVSGLIGSPLKIDNQLIAQVGWLLGGMQLVFLVMMAFVSWRAAIIGAISIPLSLIFSMLYLYATGNSLNTLVLFSLVLVLGLVVDPALVMLESIQRKIDSGLRGKDAVIAATNDVGTGVFLAALTNIIVFVPFGVISGVIGQIFSYIPLTILPATIGSYFVPLIFLAWIGGITLRPSKNTNNDEVENLWRISKLLRSLNYRILNSNLIIRIIIIGFFTVLPLAVSGYYFGNGLIKQTQFSGSNNGELIEIYSEHLATTDKKSREKLDNDLLLKVAENDKVGIVFPISANTYYIYPKAGSESTLVVKEELNKSLEKLKGKYYDLYAKIVPLTAPEANYQVSIAVKEQDLTLLRTSALEVGKVMENVCFTNGALVIDSNCSGEFVIEKVNDGYTGLETKAVDIELDRQKIIDNSLVVAGPYTGLINSQLRSRYNVDQYKSLISISINDKDIPIVVKHTSKSPAKASDLKNLRVDNIAGNRIKISDIGKVSEKLTTPSINRVNGQTLATVQGRVKQKFKGEQYSALISNAVINYYNADSGANLKKLGLNPGSIEIYSEGGFAEFQKSFLELITALLLAILLSYVVLAVFFESFTQPLVILFTVPLSFVGILPALAHFGTGELGFLEIIGIIILIGIVENVAIFLIDSGKQYIDAGMDDKSAISLAAAVRFRPVFLTTVTAVVSLTPLALTSELYRPISLVIIFGLISSGIVSLVTTPILFVFFRWLSVQYRNTRLVNQILFFVFFPIYIVWWGSKSRILKLVKTK